MTDNLPNRAPNRLSKESSPYLLQHQHNPVDWYPWGEEAFAKAREENKPLLISIGYSACHWCHVMEHESFSNEEIAKYINDSVVPVKVDREERPDVDAIYMNACTAMTGQGGWPLNAFVTPDLKPFFVGTYFPPEDKYGRPGFPTVLAKIREAWLMDGAGLRQQAEALHKQLEQFSVTSDSQSLAPNLLTDIVNDSASMFDSRNGGFGTAPKFPPDTRMSALLAAYSIHGLDRGVAMTTQTLDAMAYGGIYDQVAGGFARYSVDAQWLIPHFEKMLYNQALLIPVYTDAWLLTKKPLYERIARETGDWVIRDLTSSEGVFQCAYDADSEGEEGKFYVWTPEQISEILGDDAPSFNSFYNITSAGNFEHGTSNPSITVPPEEFAQQNNVDPETWQKQLNLLRDKVRTARENRVWPERDDKCLTGWNGLMISALSKLAQVYNNNGYAEAAARAATVLLKAQWDGQTLLRVYKDGKSSVRGTLEDYAFFADSLIDLYETDFDPTWLSHARDISTRMIALFADDVNGGFYYTDGTDQSLISRTKDTHDGALPASASIAVKTVLRLSHFYHDTAMTEWATRALDADGRRANSHPMAYASLILAELYARPELPEIVLTGPDINLILQSELLAGVRGQYLPARALAIKAADTTSPIPVAIDRPATKEVQAYLCRNFTCQAPVSDTARLLELLKSS